MRRFLLALSFLILSAPAKAHEVRPGYLQIHEIEPAVYDFTWKTPARGDMRLALNVIFPSECRAVGEARMTPSDGAVIERWRSACEGGLPGKEIAIENLAASLTDVILRFEPLSGPPKTLRITGSEPRVEIPAETQNHSGAGAYFPLGVEHILFGVDHLLFVLCLLILIGDVKRLIGAVTAFTVAHSITLAGVTFGWFSLAIAPVEACIALSIAFVAEEIIRAREGTVSATQRWPWIASFCFGLLHGFGFASALREIGLPESAAPLALFFFNLGVEAGQILFIIAVLSAVFLCQRYAPAPPHWAWRAPPYGAGIIASFWFIERTVSMFL
ncbi:HupE/UreJ family protein [Hyphococcus sp.]|jgi:hydrogenase/urease accessory protein HupE|uniref:HupE/UreJ family protein n=1 Tax=Hyphococcus sp. TaxID=2038636 RepID=UPI003D0FDDA2